MDGLASVRYGYNLQATAAGHLLDDESLAKLQCACSCDTQEL